MEKRSARRAYCKGKRGAERAKESRDAAGESWGSTSRRQIPRATMQEGKEGDPQRRRRNCVRSSHCANCGIAT